MSDKHWLDGAPRTRAKIQGRIFYANVGDIEKEMLEFTADLERETVALTAELAALKAAIEKAMPFTTTLAGNILNKAINAAREG